MKKTFLFLPVLFFLTGCSLQKIALNTTSGLFSYGIDAIYAEPDLQLAEQAIAANLKLVEGFHRADPGNEDLLFMLTQGYTSYALAFVEHEDEQRASQFYIRGRDYGLKLLRHTGAYKKGIPETEQEFVSRLNQIKQSEVPELFWTAFAWAGWINLNKDKTQAVFDLNKVKAMMQRVIELEEDYFFGAAHLFFGSILASLPPMLGGNPEQAQKEFEKCLQISDGRFLMARVYLARYYAVSSLDEELFVDTLNDVLQADINILPDHQLLTAVAKEKARILLNQKSELF